VKAFTEPFWFNGPAGHGKAGQRKAGQSYSVRVKAFTEPFWFKGTASHGSAMQSSAKPCSAKQRDKGSLLSGRFDHPAGNLGCFIEGNFYVDPKSTHHDHRVELPVAEQPADR
jgi:hypothetical protein